jgi:RNA polymerase sigma-B factor
MTHSTIVPNALDQERSTPTPRERGESSGGSEPLLEEYWRTRDPRLREPILKQYANLINSLAARFARGGVAMDDLAQVASIGLIHALERFDNERGVKFVTYAVSTMVGEIKHYFRDHTWGLKVPRHLQEIATNLPRVEEELYCRLRRSPTIAELAERFRAREEDILEAMELAHAYQPQSLDARIEFESGDSTDRVQDLMGAPDDRLEAVVEHAPLMTALDTLDERKREIVKLRYFDEWSQSEVGRRLGISQMHVSRLERQALMELRSAMGEECAVLI